MAEQQSVNTSIENRVAVVTIDRPPVNALNTQILNQLLATMTAILENSEARAVVLMGAGQRAFVAGADIHEIRQQADAQRAGEPVQREIIQKGQALCTCIESSPKPVIATINGDCLGGGLEVAMACHIRIAADSARFGQPEINLGLIPAWGGTIRLARLVGPGKAAELILSGRILGAEEAGRIGLVEAVVPANQLRETAMRMAGHIATKSALATRAALQALRHSAACGSAEALQMEEELFFSLLNTEDAYEGLLAFRDKRPPVFHDR